MNVSVIMPFLNSDEIWTMGARQRLLIPVSA
jgi:hypothetical protein